MIQQVELIERVPVELWRSIFRLYLGPSLSNPAPRGLLESRVLLADVVDVIQDYKRLEIRRTRLRLVCRYWCAVAEEMADRINATGPAGTSWPPNSSTQLPLRTLYLSGTSWRSFMDARGPYDSRKGIRFRQPITSRIIDIHGLDVTMPLPADMEMFQDPPLRVLNWTTSTRDTALYGIHHPAFRHLTFLRLGLRYPLPSSNGPVYLPDIRCLFLDLLVSAPVKGGDSLSTWRFPKLAILEITATSRYQGDQQGFALEDAAAFIDAHAATLEEISVRGPERISMGERWRTLPRLAEYHFHSIEDLAAELPDLESRWAKGHNSLSILPRIRVVFDDIFIAKGSITTIAASFRQYPTTVARLDGSIATTWKDLEIRIGESLLSSRGTFFGLMQQTHLAVSDIEGYSFHCIS